MNTANVNIKQQILPAPVDTPVQTQSQDDAVNTSNSFTNPATQTQIETPTPFFEGPFLPLLEVPESVGFLLLQ